MVVIIQKKRVFVVKIFFVKDCFLGRFGEARCVLKTVRRWQ